MPPQVPTKTPYQIEQEARKAFLQSAVSNMGGNVHQGDITAKQLGQAQWNKVALREKLIRLFSILLEEVPKKRWKQGATPCRAVAITDIGVLVGVSHGGVSAKLHAEESIAEEYYQATRRLVVPIELMYIDLEPCHRDPVSGAEQYSGHNCSLLFKTKGKALGSGPLKGQGKVRFERRSGTEPKGVYFLQHIDKGANNLAALHAEGVRGILARWPGAEWLKGGPIFSQSPATMKMSDKAKELAAGKP